MKFFRLIVCLSICCTASFATFAQKNFSKEADDAFRNESFFSAIEAYKKADVKAKPAEKARINFEKSLELDPTNENAIKNISLLNGKILNKIEIKSYLNSELRYPKADEKYVIDVARVLQRALPPHMSDVNRFVD